MPRRYANEGDNEHMTVCNTVCRNEKTPETPPLIVNDISYLFTGSLRSFEATGVMAQPSARLILRMLAGRDGIRQNDIAAATHLSAPTVSIILKRMEAEGLIRRETSLSDLRAAKVLMTDSGREADRKFLTQLEELSDVMMKGFSDEEERVLTGLLERMRGNLLNRNSDGRGANEEEN